VNLVKQGLAENASPLTLRARMYQTTPAMSTRRSRVDEKFSPPNGLFLNSQPDFGGKGATSVTWPIFRPGRGAPLP
jgi:hypothetical protein